MRFLLGSLLLAALLAAPPVAHAFETRFAVDPGQDLGYLAASGSIPVAVGHDGDVFTSDASAVLKSDPAKVLAAASDYDHYVEMGMPNLKASRIIDRDSASLYIWTWMTLYGQGSKHYLEARVVPEGLEWQLIHARPGWKPEDNPAFSRLDGSFFVKPLDGGTVYVRYFLAAVLDTSVPGWILDLVVKKQFHDGVIDVIRAIDKAAVSMPKR